MLTVRHLALAAGVAFLAAGCTSEKDKQDERDRTNRYIDDKVDSKVSEAIDRSVPDAVNRQVQIAVAREMERQRQIEEQQKQAAIIDKTKPAPGATAFPAAPGMPAAKTATSTTAKPKTTTAAPAAATGEPKKKKKHLE